MTKISQPEEFPLSSVESHWGVKDNNNFGYATDEERLEKRGMEDWEMVETLKYTQPTTPYWFIAVVVIVLLVAVGLSFPFWGLRPGVTVRWQDWISDPGFLGAIIYVTVSGVLVRYMTNMYGASTKGENDLEAQQKNDNNSEKL